MKYTAAFAVLAILASEAVVSAAPVPAYVSLMQARSMFADGALDEVRARFYNQLVESRTYDDTDVPEARSYAYDQGISERSPMMRNVFIDRKAPASQLYQKAGDKDTTPAWQRL
ncbi:hypothetical protein BKA70DRAFT_1315908, partial [Coprinopsis sp. MPI-PUGE-AT-0042]